MILVLTTAYGTDALEEGVRQLGGGYMTKPFEPSLLVEMIEDLVQGRPALVLRGDRILFGKYSGSEVTLDGEDYLVMKEEDVLGILGA